MDIKLISDLVSAEKYWNELSPNETLFENWDFRYCFYKFYQHDIYFYVGFDNEMPICLLPLQLNKNTKKLEFFGDHFDWMEDNQIFIKPSYENKIINLYEKLDFPLRLNHISKEDPFSGNFELQDYKYILNLDGFNDLNDYLHLNFNKNSRYKLKKKMQVVENTNIQMLYNNFDDLDLMIKYNLERFKDKSSFNYPFRIEIYHDLLNLPFKKHLLTFVIDKNKVGVSFAIEFNRVYTYLNAGSKTDAINNIGTYVNIKNIEHSIKIACKILDANVGDYSKDRLHLTKVPLYKFEK